MVPTLRYHNKMKNLGGTSTTKECTGLPARLAYVFSGRASSYATRRRGVGLRASVCGTVLYPVCDIPMCNCKIV